MKPKNPTHEKFPYLCIRCGFVHLRFVDDLDAAMQKPVECTKCGREARIYTLGGIMPIVRRLIQEQEAMRMQIFDLECSAEAREGQDIN